MTNQPRLTDEHGSYLERVQFDPAMFNTWVAKYIINFRLVILLIITIIAAGIASYTQIPQRLNPEIEIPIVIINTILPGASPEEVESLLTIPLENSIRSVKNINTVSSTSRDSASTIFIEFTSSADLNESRDDVQRAVSTVRDLPEDATDPSVAALDFEDQPVWQFALSSNTDKASLVNFAKTLREEVENLGEVDRVEVSGLETLQLTIQLSPEALSTYGLNPLLISDQIKKGLASYPAGTIQGQNYTYSITLDPSISTPTDIRNLPISLGQNVVSLGDIASVTEVPARNYRPVWIASANQEPQPVVTFYIFKTMNTDIDDAGEAIKLKVEELIEPHQQQFFITTIMNTADEIEHQFTDLLKEFGSTIALVFTCLLLFLGLRQALISALTVPLTFLSAFVIMRIFDMSINFLVLFSFLLSLGLLVDDTIVVVSAMTRYYRSGRFTPHQTGILVWRDTIVPIWSTTITTIWSFVPLLLASGIIGEFIKPIPIVVTATMISSTAIAVLVTLPLMIVLFEGQLPFRIKILFRALLFLAGLALVFFLLPPSGFWALAGFAYLVLAAIYFITRPLWFKNKVNVEEGNLTHRLSGSDPESTNTDQFTSAKTESKSNVRISPTNKWAARFQTLIDHGIIDIEKLAQKYYNFIYRILGSKSARRKTVMAIIIYSLVAFALVPAGLVKNEFFPKTGQDFLYVNIELPVGTVQSQTETISRELLNQVRTNPSATQTILEIGRNFNQEGGNAGPHLAQLTLILPPKDVRETDSIELAEQLRGEFKSYSNAKVNVAELSSGPPAGADIVVKFIGEDLGQLNHLADQFQAFLNQQPEIASSSKSILPSTSKLVFVPDDNALRDHQIGRDSVGLWLRTYASQFTVAQANFDKTDPDKEDIIFSLGSSVPSPEDLGRLMIPSSQGTSVSLLSLGHFESAVNPTAITRENYNRTLSVSAGVRPGFAIPEVNTKATAFLNQQTLPSGYTWSTGGVNEENARSINSIIQAMGLSFLLILVTMVIQFNSFRQAAIVLMVIPLAVSSVFIVFAITGTPLSFPALIGILSLFGIVVTNSMFIVDKINLNLRENMPFRQAVANAGSSRLEPIVLTKLSTVLGLLPITLSDPLWRGLGGAIISGILIASTIMLLFIPVVYYQWFAPKED